MFDEKELTSILDALPGAIVGFDCDYRIDGGNAAALSLLGYTEATLSGRAFVDLIAPESHQSWNRLVKALRDGDSDTHSGVELEIINSSGELRSVHCGVSAYAAPAGHKFVALLTARRGAVQAQRTLEDERQLFEAGPVIVIRWRDAVDSPVDYVSKNVETIVGYSPTEFVDDRVPTWLAIHPDDLDARQAQVAEFQKSGADKQDMGPVRLLAANGDTIWVTSFAMRLPPSADGIARFMAYSIDITDVVELEARTRKQQVKLQNVIDGTGAAIWELTLATKEFVVNDKWAEILGYRLEELHPVLFSRWSDSMHPEDLPRTLAIFDDHLAGRTDDFQAEYRLRHRDGHWVWVHDRGRIVEADKNGRPSIIAGTHVDISQRKEAQLKAQAMNEALQESNVELERFAYIASHDLQEPLRMVASFTQLLQKRYSDQLDDTAKEYIHFAVDGAKRMQQLIQDLLSYSRLGRQEIEEQVVDFSSLVGRVNQSMKITIEESNATINCIDLPVVRGDAGQLYQLLQNLISNGIKYRGESDPVIEISFSYRGDEPVFLVNDNGIGVGQENFTKVFEVFRRLHSRADIPGTGIGLSVCQRVVERHGGRIWLESVLGEGSQFCFTVAPDRLHRSEMEDEPTQAAMIVVDSSLQSPADV